MVSAIKQTLGKSKMRQTLFICVKMPKTKLNYSFSLFNKCFQSISVSPIGALEKLKKIDTTVFQKRNLEKYFILIFLICQIHILFYYLIGTFITMKQLPKFKAS